MAKVMICDICSDRFPYSPNQEQYLYLVESPQGAMLTVIRFGDNGRHPGGNIKTPLDICPRCTIKLLKQIVKDPQRPAALE